MTRTGRSVFAAGEGKSGNIYTVSPASNGVIKEEVMLKNIDVYNEPLFKKIRSKDPSPHPSGVAKAAGCSKDLRLTGLSNSGG